MSIFGKLKKAESTRRVIGAERLTDSGVKTYNHGYIAYFVLNPVNLAVLSRANVQAKINALMNLIKGAETVELTCLNSREDFEGNKLALKARLDAEHNAEVRRLLEKDLLFLDQIQIQTASAREFLLALRFDKEDEIAPNISRAEKLLKEQGFRARLTSRNDLKRIYAVYFAQNMTQVVLDEYDGERWALASPNSE
jgi:hypothetical protein